MKEILNPEEKNIFPEIIKKLPEVDAAFKGVKGWLLQGKNHQMAFFEIEPIGKVPPHSHCSQWGLIIEGRMQLTIGEKTRVYNRGDRYYIPE